jgi:cytoskeletal protein RodZ
VGSGRRRRRGTRHLLLWLVLVVVMVMVVAVGLLWQINNEVPGVRLKKERPCAKT